MFPFNARSNTFKIDVTATASTTKAIDMGNTIRIVNIGTKTAYVSIGNGSQEATLPSTTAARTCDCIPAGSDIIMNLSYLAGGSGINISAICAATETTTLIVSI